MTAIVTGIAVTGLSLMFATGSGWVSAGGDDRVALKLAQQKIEQLRGLSFGCVFTGGPQTFRAPLTGCTGSKLRRGADHLGDRDGAAAAQPSPTTRTFTRKTCVQYVSDTDACMSPAYSGGSSPTVATCPAGTPTDIKRITVVVQPARTTRADAPVILQAWISAIPGGI